MRLDRILSYARPHRGPLLAIAGLMVAQTAAILVLPWLGGRFAAGIFATDAIDIDLVLGAVVLLFGARALLGYVTASLLARTSARIVRDLRQEMFERVQGLPLRFFRERRQGDILSSIVYEPEALSVFLTRTVPSVLPNILAVIGSLVLMAMIDPVLAVLVMAVMPVFYVVLRLVGRRIRPLTMDARAAYARIVALVDENISMIPAIKAYLGERGRAALHRAEVDRLQDLSVAQARSRAFLDAVIRFLAVVAVVAMLRLLGDRVAAGEMALGEFVTFILYVVVLTGPFAALAGMWAETQIARGALARLETLLAATPEEGGAGGDLGPVRGDIRFEDIHLAYPGRGAALSGIELHLPAGTSVGLVGPNGAGKTTLVNLVMRFDSPDRGRVTIDGTDIATVSLESLRRQIAVLSQNVLLFDASVRENIAFGRPDAEEAAIQDAARRAQAHDFVAAMPDGYDTVIGERGVRLSGGQAQRIALARALLKDPAILILDEPTAMFDPEGEDAFVADARAAFAGKTVILITHRLGSLAIADRIIRLDGGRVVADETAS